jgi:hypothetical protein
MRVPKRAMLFSSSGGGEIRTLGTLRHSCFQDKCDRPLCHPSSAKQNFTILIEKAAWIEAAFRPDFFIGRHLVVLEPPLMILR